MKLKESHRRYILLGFIGFIIVGLIVAKVMAKNQSEQFLKDELLYEQIRQLYQEDQYEQAAIYVDELLKTQPNSEVVNYTGGLIAAMNKDYKKAANLLEKTLNLNPHKVEDPMFMLQLGQAFYQVERFEDAIVVLTHCQEMGWAPEDYPEYQTQVSKILTKINNENKE